MDLLGVTEISMQHTWKVSVGDMKLEGMPPETLGWHYPFRSRSFTSLIISTIMTWWPSSRISAHATEWGPAKMLPIGLRSCQGRPCLWPLSDKVHADLCLLYSSESVYQSPCPVFHHSWIPPQITWTSSPVAAYCGLGLLVATTLTGFWREIMPRVFWRRIFIPAWSHTVENRSSDLVRDLVQGRRGYISPPTVGQGRT